MRATFPERVRRRIADLTALLRFVARRRSVWLAIIVAALLVLAWVLYVAQTAAVAPYVYPLF